MVCVKHFHSAYKRRLGDFYYRRQGIYLVSAWQENSNHMEIWVKMSMDMRKDTDYLLKKSSTCFIRWLRSSLVRIVSNGKPMHTARYLPGA